MKFFVFAVLLSASTLIATGQNRAVQLRNGGNSVTLRAPNTGGHISFTLPSADGTNGQVLSTDGNGVFQWSNGGGGGGASSINDLTDGALGGANFTNSVLLGHDYTAGQLVTASNNTGLGTTALDALTTGDNNVAVGYDALISLTSGSSNTIIGTGAGAGLTTGSGNVFIGYQAGVSESGSNLLYVTNTNDSSPLIYGDFASDALTINGSLKVTSTSTFEGASVNTPATSTAKTGATTTPYTTFDSFTSSFVKVAVTASASGGSYVKLPAGTDGQVVYLRMAFTAAAGNNSVTIVNSDAGNSNTAMVYDGTGSDVIVAQMMYSSTDSRWVIFSAILNP